VDSVKSPIKYFGGKGNMFQELLDQFPKDDEYKVYLEPFGGSAAMLLSRPLGHVEIYNDIYANVYSLFKALSDKSLFDKFKSKCDLAIYSAQLRKEYKEKLKETGLSIVDRAYYFWYVNRTSHNGIGGWSANCYVRRKMSKATSDFLSCIDRMPELHDRLSAVIVENRDAIELMEKYNQSNVFMYLDPPYHQDTRGSARYVHDYTNEQHEAFIDCVLELDAKVLISGYICKAYERLSPKFTRIDFNVKTVTGTGAKKTKVESLWKNY
jgi:DNA adenine methylase